MSCLAGNDGNAGVKHRHLQRPDGAAICRESRLVLPAPSNKLLERCDSFSDLSRDHRRDPDVPRSFQDRALKITEAHADEPMK